MKKRLDIVFIGTVIVFVSTNFTVVSAKEKIIEGLISEYECGDNCYLTIKDAEGKEHIGLCAAPLCRKWNESAEMPIEFKGRKVRITVGKGLQYDGEGNIAGETDSFEKIDRLK